MNLTIIDRIAILLGMLPVSSNINGIQFTKSIRSKLMITPDEEKLGIVFDKNENGEIYLKYISDEAKAISSDMNLTPSELTFLKNCATELDKKAGVTEFNYDTVIKLINQTQ